MKYRVFSVLMILAMVASLCAMAAVAPASAAVGAATVTTTNNLAGQASGYTVAFTLGASGSLSASTDSIFITFPSGTTLPSSFNYTNVLVSTSGTSAMSVGSGGVSVSGQTVTVRMPTSAPAGDTVTVTISQAEGIKNPTLSREPSTGGDGQGSSGYTLSVRTSNTNDATAVNSSAYYIYNWVSCSPMAAAMGGQLTVTGGGFLAGSSVNLAAVGGGSGSGTVASDGTFTIVAFASGLALPITATDGSGRTAATAAITVLPRLSVTPTSGNIGSAIMIKGYDFVGTPNSATNSIFIGGIAVNAATLVKSDQDNDGFVDDFAFGANIPIGLAGGSKVVQVVDNGATGSPSATASVTVANQAVTVDPASGPAGATVVLTGAGWPPSATTTGTGVKAPGTLLFAYSSTTQAVIGDGAVETDGTGAFTEMATIPANATPGMTAIVCSFGGATGSTALAYFTVTANALNVSPTSGPKGTKVTISGGGLTGSSSVAIGSLTIGGAAWNTAAITLDTQGNLTPTTLTVASTVAEGVNTIVARDATGLTAAGTFEVVKPTLELDVTQAYRGQTVTATGSNWMPGILGLVTITLGGQTMQVVQPDGDGNVWAQFQVPSNLTVGATTSFSAADNYGNASMSGTLAVPNPKLTVDPASGPVGSTITITGEGFLPLTALTGITMTGVALLPAGTVLTNSVGGFTATATVPGLSPGGHGVSATANETASTSFTISASAAAAATPATGFATIADTIVIAWAFDAATQQWEVYDPAEGAPSTLTVLTTGQGYWVQVAEDCTLTYGSKTYDLKAGWNLIGWLG